MTAGKLARFLGLSKTPVLAWITSGLLRARKRGNRWLVAKAQVLALLAAADAAAPYVTQHPREFYRLRRLRQKVRLPDQDVFTPRGLSGLFTCSVSTICRAIRKRQVVAYCLSPFRWAVKRKSLLESPLFGRLIWRPRQKHAPPGCHLERKDLFTTREVAAKLGVSQQTVRNLMRDGQLERVRVGCRNLRVTRKSLRNYLRAAQQPAG
ncbi:MAG: helix-turn-helix domain-containing protein [Verrucomicrobia bacterium]|nr:helix-turn-helix domain-containing protein [Verrucomicrobiota bacterium]